MGLRKALLTGASDLVRLTGRGGGGGCGDGGGAGALAPHPPPFSIAAAAAAVARTLNTSDAATCKRRAVPAV